MRRNNYDDTKKKRRDRIRDGVKEWESNVEYFIRYWSKMLNGEIYVVKRYDDDGEHIEECEYHNIDKVFKNICGDHLKK